MRPLFERLSMKKFFALIIGALVLLTGCSGGPEPISTVFGDPWSNPIFSDGGEEPVSSDTSDSSDSSTASEPQSPDLSGAARNVWLFGKRIPLPCRFNEFGEDFTLGEEYFYQLNKDLIAFLCYKGEVIGEVILENCTEEDPNKSAKKVVQLALGDAQTNPVKTDGWYNDTIYFDVMGVTMDSGFDDVKKLLGDPTKKEGLDRNIRVSYKISDSKYIEITFRNDRIVEFVIESRDA